MRIVRNVAAPRRRKLPGVRVGRWQSMKKKVSGELPKQESSGSCARHLFAKHSTQCMLARPASFEVALLVGPRPKRFAPAPFTGLKQRPPFRPGNSLNSLRTLAQSLSEKGAEKGLDPLNSRGLTPFRPPSRTDSEHGDMGLHNCRA